MKRSTLLSAVIFCLVPLTAFAAGPVSSTGSSAQSTSQVNVTIPATIAIDVESNVTFDFTGLSAGSPLQCTDKFPPGADCATAIFHPTSATEPLSGVSPNIWLAIFSNQSGHTDMTVTAYADSTFTSSPGFTPGAIKIGAASSNNSAVNGVTFGYPSGSEAFLSTSSGSPTTLKQGAGAMSTSIFGWSRIDQSIFISVPGTTAFNAVSGVTANIYFTLSHS